MKRLVLIGIVFLAVCAMGSCTNNEGESDFDTVKPNLPGNPEEGTATDTITVRMNTVEVRKL